MADGIWERSWSAMSIAWFTLVSSCRRRSCLASYSALFLRIVAWVSVKDLISPQTESTRALDLSLWPMISSCWRQSASCFWALRTCTRWLSMKAAGVNASSIASGSLPSRSSRIALIGLASLTSRPMSWFRNWSVSWSLALTLSGNAADSADAASPPSSWEIAPIWKENRLLFGDSCA